MNPAGDDVLASGFRDVDRAGDFAVFSGCLELVDSIPFFAEVKRESFGRLGLAPGMRVLDVGCGLGRDAAELAGMVAPGGEAVGVDASRAMVDAARSKYEGVPGLRFETADAAALPFESATFDACRVDRVLQHVADPSPALREMARVLRPGGRLVAFDNDWETLTVDAPDRRLTRLVLNAWCDRFPSGWVGRRLVPLFLEAGLTGVVATPRTLVLRDLDLADRLYCFFATADRLAGSGALTRAEAERWSHSLRQAAAEGRLFSSYTGFLVSGRLPVSAD